jgi:hypothetical protein
LNDLAAAIAKSDPPERQFRPEIEASSLQTACIGRKMEVFPSWAAWTELFDLV